MTAPALTFLAPPSFGDPQDEGAVDATAPARARSVRDRSAGPLRLTRGARAAATGMKIAEADIRRCLDVPDDASPDPRTPSRTRFRRGNLVVLAGADGMVLRVDRRGR